MKFFDINELGKYQGGTISQSSGDAGLCFTDTTEFAYTSVGQTASTVTLERKLDEAARIDSIFVLNSNFDDLTIYASSTSGGAYVDITSNATLTTSLDGLNRFYKFDTPFFFFDIKFEIVNTTPISQEKTVGANLGHVAIGEIIRFSDIDTKEKIIQKKAVLEAGGIVTMNKGRYWSFKVKTKYVGVQNEIDIARQIQKSDREFFFWLNGGFIGEQKVLVEPYRFQDLIKCASTPKPKPSFHKNYLNTVVDDTITFEQAGSIQ